MHIYLYMHAFFYNHECILIYIYILYLYILYRLFSIIYIYKYINIIPEEPWKCSVPLTLGRLVTIFFPKERSVLTKFAKHPISIMKSQFMTVKHVPPVLL